MRPRRSAWPRPALHDENDRQNDGHHHETLQERKEVKNVVAPVEAKRREAARITSALDSGGDESGDAGSKLVERPSECDGKRQRRERRISQEPLQVLPHEAEDTTLRQNTPALFRQTLLGGFGAKNGRQLVSDRSFVVRFPL